MIFRCWPYQIYSIFRLTGNKQCSINVSGIYTVLLRKQFLLL
jgi:hypothetical protein